MAKKQVIVTGDKQLDKKLSQLETKVQTKIARDELKKVTKKLVAVARNNLGIAGHIDEGKLARGIKAGANKRSRSKIGRHVRTSERSGSKSGFGGAQIELGSKNRNMPEDSFLRRALYGNQKYIRDEIIKGIEGHIRTIEVPKP